MNEDQKLKIRNNLFGIIQLIAVIAFVAGALIISTSLKSGSKEEPTPLTKERKIAVNVENIKPSSYQIKFQATGAVTARNNINIVSQVSGVVTSVNDNFYTGGSFKKNTTLFQIEPKDFEIEVDVLQATVAQAQTKYNLEKAEADIALSEWSQLHGDTPAPRLVARKPQLNEAWRNLKSAKARLEKAKLNLSRASFSLPFDGKVSSSTIDIGQFVVAGQSYGSLYDTQSLEVVSSLKDNEIEWLLGTKDPKIEILTKHLGNSKTYEGYLKRSAAKLDDLTRFATIAIGFKEPPENIIPGLFVNLNINGPTLENVHILPSSAIQKGGIIWQLDTDGKLQKLDFTTLYSNNDLVVIRDGDKELKIITSKISGASAGQTVQVISPEEKGNSDE